MSAVQDELQQLLTQLTSEQREELLDFARFLHEKNERRDWQQLSLNRLAEAYGDDEPEYASTMQ